MTFTLFNTANTAKTPQAFQMFCIDCSKTEERYLGEEISTCARTHLGILQPLNASKGYTILPSSRDTKNKFFASTFILLFRNFLIKNSGVGNISYFVIFLTVAG